MSIQNDSSVEVDKETSLASQISRVSIKAPPFWKNNPNLWFAQIEAQFEISGITKDETKFYHVVAAIESNVLDFVQDIVISPPEREKYTTLKKRITEMFSVSDSSKLRTLLQGIELGDQRPSMLLKRMRELAGKHFSDDLLKSLWLDRLPENVKLVLVASNEELSSLAIMADKILELVPQPTVNYTALGKDASNNSTLEQKVAELSEQVSKLANIVKNAQNFPRSRSTSLHRNRSFSRNGRYPSPNWRSNNSKICFYHKTFGTLALKCKGPCNFFKTVPKQKDDSEN